MKVRILGVGNDSRGDDGAGLVVARALRTVDLPTNVEVREVDGEAMALLDAFQGADAVIVVDAVASGASPGTLHRFDARGHKLKSELFAGSTHAFGVAQAVELARALALLPERLIVIGIEGGDFTLGAPVTPAVTTALPDAVRGIVDEARRCSSE